MTDPSLYIEETVAELQDQVDQMESNMNDLVIAFLATFAIDNKELINAQANYEHANSSDSVFDEAYKTFVGAFLVYLGNKIIKGTKLTVSDLSSRGINAIGNEEALVEKMIGFVDGKIIRKGFLYNLGQMSSLRSSFHNYIIKSIASSQKVNLFLRNAKPLFVSEGKTRSAFSNYYMKYAYDSVAQAMNSISLYIADKNELTHFLYAGSLVPKSRQFCIDHVGQVFSREDAKRFNEESWNGKIEGVDFLIVAGGWKCMHHIQWLPNE